MITIVFTCDRCGSRAEGQPGSPPDRVVVKVLTEQSWGKMSLGKTEWCEACVREVACSLLRLERPVAAGAPQPQITMEGVVRSIVG